MNQSVLDQPIEEDVYGMPAFQQDKRLHVTFYRKAVKNNFKSEQEGRPIYDEKDYIKIFIPGDRNSNLDVPATEHYQQRFRAQWDRYQSGQSQLHSGTPLETWGDLSVSQVAELKAIHVHTVEQLADMPDQLAQKFMGNFALREKAKAYLNKESELAKASALKNELALRDAALEEQKARTEALEKQLAELIKAQAQVKTDAKPAEAKKA